MTNYDILQEYEAHKTPVPSYQEYLESESHCAVYSEVNKSLKEQNERLKEQLEIAIKALHLYSNLRGDGTVSNYESVAKTSLEQIKELDK